jgi:hypothetical protein
MKNLILFLTLFFAFLFDNYMTQWKENDLNDIDNGVYFHIKGITFMLLFLFGLFLLVAI